MTPRDPRETRPRTAPTTAGRTPVRSRGGAAPTAARPRAVTATTTAPRPTRTGARPPAAARPARPSPPRTPTRPTRTPPRPPAGGGRPPRPPRTRRPLKLGLFHRRMGWALAFVLVALLVISFRLVWLQGLDGGNLAGAAAAQRTQVIALHALRGTIYDRDGVPLAYTDDARDITADPTLISADERSVYASQLASVLKIPALDILQTLTGTGHYAVIARSVAPVVGQQVMNLKLIGVYSQGTTVRQYPGKTTGANVIGLIHDNGTGADGVEAQYDSVLRGTDGSITYPNDGNGNPSPGGTTTLVPAQNGGSVKLTISQDLQYMVQQEIDSAVTASGATDGEVVVMTKTGQVLAMAATGTYDSSDSSTWGQNAANRGTNPPIQQLFEPGSVNKIVTFSAALQAGLITPTTTLQVPDFIRTGGVTVHDDWSHPQQTYTATGVIAKSSNVGTLEIANRVGPTAFYQYLQKFGLGQLTGIGLPGEEQGLLPKPSDWSDSTFANLPIGQGVAITALQLAGMYQTIANDGVRIPPRIVESTTASDGAVTTTEEPQGIQVVSAATAETMRTMLEMVTQKGGTGTKAAIPGYRIAGKTGTAQQVVNGKYVNDKDWDTFAGMAPADDPQFVVSVMVNNPAHGLQGGDVAAPVFHAIAAYELQHAKIAPSGSLTTPVPLILP